MLLISYVRRARKPSPLCSILWIRTWRWAYPSMQFFFMSVFPFIDLDYWTVVLSHSPEVLKSKLLTLLTKPITILSEPDSPASPFCTHSLLPSMSVMSNNSSRRRYRVAHVFLYVVHFPWKPLLVFSACLTIDGFYYSAQVLPAPGCLNNRLWLSSPPACFYSALFLVLP